MTRSFVPYIKYCDRLVSRNVFGFRSYSVANLRGGGGDVAIAPPFSTEFFNEI